MLLNTLPDAEAKPVPKSKNKKYCQDSAGPPCVFAKKPTAVLSKTKKVILGFVIST